MEITMEIEAAPTTETRNEYRVMRSTTGRRARVWNTQPSREAALEVIRKESAVYHAGQVRFGIRHVEVTEVIHGIEWEPEA
jgi:hypothetical protein